MLRTWIYWYKRPSWLFSMVVFKCIHCYFEWMTMLLFRSRKTARKLWPHTVSCTCWVSGSLLISSKWIALFFVLFINFDKRFQYRVLWLHLIALLGNNVAFQKQRNSLQENCAPKHGNCIWRISELLHYLNFFILSCALPYFNNYPVHLKYLL